MAMPRSLLFAMFASASASLVAQSAPSTTAPATILFTNARLISGTAAPVVENGALLMERGRITRVGSVATVTAPAGATRIDLTGKTLMPALVATHVHPGFQRGTAYSADLYNPQTVVADLERALYFGVGVVQSQGIEGDRVLDGIRASQGAGTVVGARLLIAGAGIGAPNAGPGGAAYRGIAYEITTEAEARSAVRELAGRQVDLVKIWVDDRNGRAPRLGAPLYRAVIDKAHARRLRVNAHVFYHDDAVELVEAGIDGFAHLVRDREMDAVLVAAIVKRGVYVMGNLSYPRKGTHTEAPAWLSEGHPLWSLVQASTPSAVIDRMRQLFVSRDAAAVARSRERYEILRRSWASLTKAGARLILGADTGLEDHLFGVAEHLEMDAMVEAGMTPAECIVAATSRSAEFLGLADTGRLAPGMRADFLVLDANPLDDIRNVARVADVYANGVRVDRAAIASRLRLQ